MDFDRAFVNGAKFESTLGSGTLRTRDDVLSWTWADMLFDPAKGANQVSFSSGLGDGAYASYWGLDENGEIVSLVTDFGLYLTVDGMLVGPLPPLDEA